MNALQYIKNVVSTSGKQLVFDTVQTYLPGTTALASDSADLAKELYTNVKDFVANPMDNRIIKEYADIGKDFAKDFRSNLFEDLKTGKWYNEQRETAAGMDVLNDMFGGGFGDDVFNNNFDDDDFGDWEFEDEDQESSTLAEMSSDKANTAAIIKNEQLVGERVANSVSAATVNSADYIVRSNSKSSKALFSLNKTGFAQMNSGMAAINANISNLVSLCEPITTHIQNSAAFFSASTEYQQQVLQRLDAIQSAITLPERKSPDRRKTITDFLMNNTLDIKSFLENIGTNFKSMTSMFLGGDSTAMVKAMLNGVKNSPMHFLLSSAVKLAIPEAIKNSAKYFEDAMGHFWTGALDRMRNIDFGDSPLGLIWDFAKDMIAPKSGYKKKIDPSKYNREAMHWDGEAKKALTYVIPRQLSEIIGLLGGTRQHFDYRSGTFKAAGNIRQSFETEAYNAAVRGGGDYFSQARRAINKAGSANGYNKKELASIQDQLDLYNRYIFENENDETSYRVNNKNYKNSRMYNKLKKDRNFKEEDFAKALEFLEMFNESLNTSHEGRRLRNSYRTSMVEGRESRGRVLSNYEEYGSIYGMLFDEFQWGKQKQKPGSSIKQDKRRTESVNGSSGNKSKLSEILGVDKYGNDMWYYMQGIYLHTKFVMENFKFLIPTNGYGISQNSNGNIVLKDVEIDRNNQQKSKTPRQNVKRDKDQQKQNKNKKYGSSEDIKNSMNEYVNSSVNESSEDKDLEGLSREVLDYASVKEAYESQMKEGDKPFEETADYNAEYEKIIKAHGGVKKLKKSIKGKILQNQTLNSFFTKMNKYLKMPEEVMDKITAGVEASTMRSLYGKNSNTDKGVFQVINEGFTTLFGKLGSFLDEIFPPFLTDGVRTLWRLLFGENIGDAEGTHEGGLFSGLFNATKGAMKNAGNWLMGGNNIPDNDIAASGSGLMGYAGGASGKPKSEAQKKKEMAEKQRKMIEAIEKRTGGKVYGSTNSIVLETANGVVEVASDKVRSGARRVINEAKESANSGGLRKAIDFLGESVGQLASGVAAAAKAIIPDSIKGKEIGDEEKKKVADGVETLGKEMGLNKGNMGMGALIGAGASLMTGAIIGPIAGAAIGAGVGLLVSSQKTQDLLFGTKEEREEDPDKFNHKVGNWIDSNKKALGLGTKGAAIGTLAGAFMGSPVLGTVLGGAIGFASGSEKAKKWLFGDEENEGLIPKQVQEMIKERLPGIGAGAIAGLIMGPLPSLPANIILGSALGFAAKSEKVQSWLFGDKDEDGKRDGGALGWLKKNIGNPIVSIFDKLSEAIKVHARNIADDIKKTLRGFTTKLLAGFVRGPLKALANSKLGRGVTGAVKGIAKAPFKFASWGLKRIDTGLEKSALRKGYSIKSRELGRNLNMAERAKLRDDDFLSKNSKMAGIEDYIGSLTAEDLMKFDEEVSGLIDPSAKYTNEANKMRGDLKSELTKMGKGNDNTLKELQKIYKAADKGDVNAIKKLKALASSGSISQEDYESARKKITQLINTRSKAKRAETNKEAATEDILGRTEYANTLKSKLGLSNFDLSDAQLRNIKDLIADEKAYKEGLENDEKAKKEEEAGSPVTTNNLLTTISEFVSDLRDWFIYGKRQERPGDKIENVEEVAEETSDIVDEAKNVANAGKKAVSKRKQKKDIVEGAVKTSADGKKYVYTNGEWKLDTSDSETAELQRKDDEQAEAIKEIAKNTGILGTIGNFLGGIKEKLFGSKDKNKKGLFGTLLDLLTGKGTGVLSFLGNFFGGAKNVAGQFLVKTIGSNGVITASSLIANVLGPALLIGGFAGWFNDILGKIGLSGSDGTPEDGDDRNEYEKDENGKLNPTKKKVVNRRKVTVNAETGEMVDPSSIRSLKSDKDSFSTSLWKNTTRGLLTGTSSLASKILGNTNAGKAVMAAVAKNGGIVQTVVNMINDAIPKICSGLKKLPVLKGMGDKIDDFGLSLMLKLEEKAPAAAAKLGKFAGDFVVFAKIAFVVIDFTTGYEDASTTLKVKEPTVGDRVLCGVLRVLKNCIPVIGTLIPDDFIVDLFVEKIGPAFGMESGNLKQRRDEYQAEIDEYNKENGTNLTVAQYNKQVRHDYTWTQRIGNHLHSAVAQTKEAYNQAKANGASGIEAFGAAAVQFGKGILADYPQLMAKMFKYAMDGDLKGLWDAKSEYFSKTNENDAEVGLFSNIVGQLPLISTKVPLTVMAILAKGVHWVGDKFNAAKEGIMKAVDGAKKTLANIGESVVKGDISSLWNNVVLGGDGKLGALEGIAAVQTVPAALILSIPTLLTAGGKWLGEKLAKPVESAKKSFLTFKNIIGVLWDQAKTGHPSEVIKTEFRDEEGNPIGGLMEGATIISKLIMAIPAVFFKFGSWIKEKFNDVKEGIHKGIEAAETRITNIATATYQGDVTSMWSNTVLGSDAKLGLGDAFGAIKTVPAAMILTPVALMFKFGHWVKGKIDSISQSASNHVSIMTTIDDELWAMAKAGDPEGIMGYEVEEDPENPMGGFTRASIGFNKFVFSGIGYLYKFGHWAKEKFNDIVDGVKTYVEKRDKISLELWEVAKEGDIGKLWATDSKDDDGNPVGGIYKGVVIGSKLLFSIPALVYGLGNSISNVVTGITDSINKASDNYHKGTETLDRIYKNSTGFDRISKLYTTKDPNENNDSGMGKVYSFAFGIKRTTMTIGAIFGSIFDSISEHWDSLKEKLGDAWDSFKSWFGGGDKATVSESGATVENTYRISDSGAVHTGTSGGFGSGLAAGSSFISQLDPRYRDMSLGGNTVGKLGCGPAAAAMASNDLGRKGNMGSAVALASRYQTADGTDAAYFADYAARNGMKATYYVAGGSMVDDIRAGHPTVLMGQDPYNDSKANSPFGPNNHYVVAKGMDSSGNVIVQDPELRGTRKYSSRILGSVKMGIGLSGGATTKDDFTVESTPAMPSNISKNISGTALTAVQRAMSNNNSSTSKGMIANDNPSKIWAIIRSKGVSEAATAGILGNMQAESGCNPGQFQYGGGPGRGLCQWEGYDDGSGRYWNLVKFANERGTDWTDLETQVEFMWSELQTLSSAYWKGSAKGMQRAGAAGTTFEEFIKSNDVAMATRQFEGAFERAGKPALEKRINYAVEFYNRFTGQNLVYDGSGAVMAGQGDSSNGGFSSSAVAAANATGGTVGGADGEKKYSILSLGSIFSDVFNESVEKLFGTGGTKGSSSATVGTMGSSTNGTTGSYGTTGGSNFSTSGGYISAGVANDFPYYNQGDEPWGPMSYGKAGTVKTSGCGPTSMAMVLKSYGVNATPTDTANWSVANGYRIEGKGTSWDFFNALGKQNGLDTVQFTDSATAKKYLQQNIPVIASMKPGDFTKGGHFLVLSGLKNDGEMVSVNDPGSRNRTEKLWNTDNSLRQAKQFWAISKDGKGSLGTFSGDGQSSTLLPTNVSSNISGTGLTAMQRSMAENKSIEDAKKKSELPSNVSKNISGTALTAMQRSMAAGASGLPLGGEAAPQIGIVEGTNATMASPTLTKVDNAYNVAERTERNTSNKATLIMMKAMLEVIESVVKNTNNIDKIYEVLVAMAEQSGNNDDGVMRKILKSIGNKTGNPEDTFSVLKAKVDQLMDMAT